MVKIHIYFPALLIALGLSACGSLQQMVKPSATGVDGVACAGNIGVVPAGLATVQNGALLREAEGASGKGGVCTGSAFLVKQDMRVFRVWDSHRRTSTYGKWWAITKPSGGKEPYRQANAICKSWSALDHLVSCKLKAGTQIVLGTTQSATCDEGTYPKSPTIQLYVHGKRPGDYGFLEHCVDEGAWPKVL